MILHSFPVFERLGHFLVRRSKVVLIIYAITILAAGGIGSLAFGKLDSGGYSDLSSESAKAATYLTEKFGVVEPVAVLVVDTGDKAVDDPQISQAAIALEKKLSQVPGVSKTLSFWSTGGAPSMKATDGKAAFLFAYANLSSSDFNQLGKIGKEIQIGLITPPNDNPEKGNLGYCEVSKGNIDVDKWYKQYKISEFFLLYLIIE